MYVLIDRQLMAITHKHQDRSVLADISWIECTNAAIALPLGNPKHFNEFTPAELKKIYKNATGVELQGYGNGLAQAVHDMAKRLPESVVNAAEARAQRLTIMDGDRSCYQYAPGSMKPTVHAGLFEPDPLKCDRSESEEAMCKTVAGHSGVTPPPSSLNPFAQQDKVPSAPRAGGVKEIVFRVADELWEKAGKPTGLKDVLTLRKTMMDVLESDHSIKRTTASTSLGDWQKQRIS